MLDLLVVAAEHLKLLFVGPLLVGALAYGIGYLLPQKFVSEAYLVVPVVSTEEPPLMMLVPPQTSAQVASVIVSPAVLESVVQALGRAGDEPVADGRKRLARAIKASVGRDGMVRIAVTAPAPREAQSIANKLIDVWLKTTGPAERDRVDLEKRLAEVRLIQESTRRAVDRLMEKYPTRPGELPDRAAADGAFARLIELQNRHAAELVNLERLLRGYSRDVVVLAPTLPSEAEAPRKGEMALVAAASSAFVLLVLVLIRAAWRHAGGNPVSAAKLARVRSGLWR